VKKWQALKPMRDSRYFWGIGYGADMNGFGGQGSPRTGAKNPVKYPFKSFDGAVTLDKPKTGERTWDINTDGVAHYGLYPDWVEDLRMQAGNEIVDDMARGAEAYLEMWERTIGIPAFDCCAPHRPLTRRGFSDIRLGDSYVELLQRAGQPSARNGRVWTYPIRAGHTNDKRRVTVVLTRSGNAGLVAVSGARTETRGKGRFVRGRRFVAVAARRVNVRESLKLAGLRR
jgi:hypothetical protein